MCNFRKLPPATEGGVFLLTWTPPGPDTNVQVDAVERSMTAYFHWGIETEPNKTPSLSRQAAQTMAWCTDPPHTPPTPPSHPPPSKRLEHMNDISLSCDQGGLGAALCLVCGINRNTEGLDRSWWLNSSHNMMQLNTPMTTTQHTSWKDNKQQIFYFSSGLHGLHLVNRSYFLVPYANKHKHYCLLFLTWREAAVLPVPGLRRKKKKPEQTNLMSKYQLGTNICTRVHTHDASPHICN